MINPWAILAVVLLLVSSTTAGFLYGKGVGRDGLIAEQAAAAEKEAKKEAEKGRSIAEIAAQAGAVAALELNKNAGVTHESVERIHYTTVPGECRDVDAGIVSELRSGRDDINAALGSGLRRIAAAAGAGDSTDPP